MSHWVRTNQYLESVVLKVGGRNSEKAEKTETNHPTFAWKWSVPFSHIPKDNTPYIANNEVNGTVKQSPSIDKAWCGHENIHGMLEPAHKGHQTILLGSWTGQSVIKPTLSWIGNIPCKLEKDHQTSLTSPASPRLVLTFTSIPLEGTSSWKQIQLATIVS